MTTNDMACSELVELVTDLLDDALDAGERARIEEHLAGCDGCRAHLAQVRATLRVAGALAQEDLPPETEESLVALFRTWAADDR